MSPTVVFRSGSNLEHAYYVSPRTKNTEKIFSRRFTIKIETMGAFMIKILKAINFIFLGFLFVGGVTMLIVSSLAMKEFDDSPWIDHDQYLPPIALLTTAIIIIIICGFGVYANFRENHHLLIAFTMFLMIATVVEIIIGIMAIRALHNYPEYCLEQLRSATKVYTVSKVHRQKLDVLQRNLKCCGIDDPSSWSLSFIPPTLPISCCISLKKDSLDGDIPICYAKPNLENIHSTSCLQRLNSIVENSQRNIMAISILTALLQVVIIIVIICLTLAIKRQHKWKTVIVNAFKEVSDQNANNQGHHEVSELHVQRPVSGHLLARKISPDPKDTSIEKKPSDSMKRIKFKDHDIFKTNIQLVTPQDSVKKKTFEETLVSKVANGPITLSPIFQEIADDYDEKRNSNISKYSQIMKELEMQKPSLNLISVSNEPINFRESKHDHQPPNHENILQAKFDNINSEIIKSQTKLDTINSEISRRQSKLDSINSEITKLHLKLATSNTDIVESQEKLDKIDPVISKLQVKLNTINFEISESQLKLDTINSEITRRQSRLDSITSEISIVQSKLNSNNAEITKSQEKLGTFDYEFNKLQMTLGTINSEIVSRQSKLDTINTEITEHETKLNEINPRVLETTTPQLTKSRPKSHTRTPQLGETKPKMFTITHGILENQTKFDTISPKLSKSRPHLKVNRTQSRNRSKSNSTTREATRLGTPKVHQSRPNLNANSSEITKNTLTLEITPEITDIQSKLDSVIPELSESLSQIKSNKMTSRSKSNIATHEATSSQNKVETATDKTAESQLNLDTYNLEKIDNQLSLESKPETLDIEPKLDIIKKEESTSKPILKIKKTQMSRSRSKSNSATRETTRNQSKARTTTAKIAGRQSNLDTNSPEITGNQLQLESNPETSDIQPKLYKIKIEESTSRPIIKMKRTLTSRSRSQSNPTTREATRSKLGTASPQTTESQPNLDIVSFDITDDRLGLHMNPEDIDNKPNNLESSRNQVKPNTMKGQMPKTSSKLDVASCQATKSQSKLGHNRPKTAESRRKLDITSSDTLKSQMENSQQSSSLFPQGSQKRQTLRKKY